MEQGRDLADYRVRLLDGLTVGVRSSACGPADPIHVFVNERRVGLLNGGGTEAMFQLQSQTCIDNVQLRSEDGILLGGISAPEYGFKTIRIPLAWDTIELRVHNTTEGGSVNAVYMPAPSLWRRTLKKLAGAIDATVRRPATAIAPGIRAIAFTQALLAILVVGLAIDRITVWKPSERAPSPVTRAEAPWAASLTEVAKLEQQLNELARMQAKAVDTVQSQHEGMAQLQQAIAKLSSTQDTVVSGMVTVRRELEQRQKRSGREVKRMTQLLLSKAQTEQEQLAAEVQSLTIANDRLSKERADLEQNNEDLKKKLKSAGLDVSKAAVSDHESMMTARQAGGMQPSQTLQAADGRPNAQPQPFLFWVTFSEGTTQESIDQWLHEMQGHKGALSEGWQEVRIVQPAIPPDRFLEQIKGAKIVKAVRVSR